MSRPPNFLDAALHYVGMGWPVFPLAPRSTLPLIPARNGGKGLHDATTDLTVIFTWWEANPTANIGLRTGIAFDVIDLVSEAAVDAMEGSTGRARACGARIIGACGVPKCCLGG